MTTTETAHRLISMCRDGKVEEAKEELFSEDIISIEPMEGLLPKEVKGMSAIRNKAQLFIAHVENFFGQKISEPFIAGDWFTVLWESDLQMKGEERKANSEICLYHVKDGKIISEQFFY